MSHHSNTGNSDQVSGRHARESGHPWNGSPGAIHRASLEGSRRTDAPGKTATWTPAFAGVTTRSGFPEVRSIAHSDAGKRYPLLRARIAALVLGLLSSMALMSSAPAATITVGNTGDPATGNAAKCNVASTCTLRDAIASAAAVTHESGDTIVFSLPADSTITLSGSELVIDRNLTIDGRAVPGLAASGNGASRVLVVKEGVAATLRALAMRNGHVSEDSGGAIANRGTLVLIDSTVENSVSGQGVGGGIYNHDGGVLTLIGSTVSGNTSYRMGGGIANFSSTLTLNDSTVANNKATSDGGGGIFSTAGSLILTNSVIKDNTALSGGGIEKYSGTATLIGCTISRNYPAGIAQYYGTMSITDSVVADNVAKGGAGGIYNFSIMTLTRSRVENNTAVIADFYGRGGGIHNVGVLTLSSSVVANNAVAGEPATSASGGGIYNGLGNSLTLIDSTIAGNSTIANSGGGGGISSEGFVTLINSTVSGNVTGAQGDGGGISGGGLTLINSTVTQNVAGRHGGGIHTFSATLLQGTIAGNTAAGSNSDIYNVDRDFEYFAHTSAVNTIIQHCEADGLETRAVTDSGGNLDGGSGCGFVNVASRSNATLDLAPLADQGGPTLTMLPGPHSDAIGRGIPSGCNGEPVAGKDQRGYPRTGPCTSGAADPPKASVSSNQRGLGGAWADPTTDSQGLVIDVGQDFYGTGAGLLFAGWYTFDAIAAGGQRWYTLQAQANGKAPVSAGIYSTTGGRFDSPQATTTVEVGRATLAFSSCSQGTLDYVFHDGTGRSGRIPLRRLLSDTTCSPGGDSGDAAVPTLLSGAWADTGNSGQGLVFDMNAADNVVFGGWYTFAPDANGEDPRDQHWYTLQARFKPGTHTPNSVGIYESTGGLFNLPADTWTVEVGMANLVFNTCTSATLQYTFTRGPNSGRTGTLDLTRVGAAPSGCQL